MSNLVRLVQSAAYSVECPGAAFFKEGECGFHTVASFGFAALEMVRGSRILDEARYLRVDSVMIVNDVTRQPGYGAQDGQLFDMVAPVIRFVAAARVSDASGATLGILVVADPLPHAGLSAAKLYVLRAHAAQLAALLELQTLRDASEQKQLYEVDPVATERLRLLESVVVNANDAVLITSAEPIDLPGPRIVYCNAAFTRTTGYSAEEILGRTPRLLQGPGTDRTALDRLRRALSRWKPIEVELLNHRKDGTEFWVELSIVPVANEKGWFTHWVSVQRDISDRKAAEETATRARVAQAENMALEAEIQERKQVEAQLLYTAFHDNLTKLRNRAFFMDRLAVALARAKSDPSFRIAVLFLDLDRFKLINDSLGHRAGDLLLMEIAQRLGGCVRPQDTLARLGGDEFALLIEGLDAALTAATLGRRLAEAVRPSLWLGSQEVFPSCSVGVVEATAEHSFPEDMLRDADIAMYQAKRHDTGNFAIFTDSMLLNPIVALELQTDLRNAVARGEFCLHYQPICNPVTLKIIGLEALVRWEHPVRGYVPPIDFITSAEETGLIREIGRWVLHEACTQMRQWLSQFPGLSVRLSVNASAEELRDDCFARGVEETLTETGFDPRLLQLEITESIFLQQPAHVEKVLGDIRKLGVRIALDDFGTGYSSLSYLDRFRIDTIKIDQSFVVRMMERPTTMAIVETIVRLGQALGLDIVAEGVEQDAELQALIAIGCSSVQGYALGRPQPVCDMTPLLSRQYDQKARVIL
ncbi:MAG: putative bifunctional diguanylate cyclase/phosphodiesterase [Janthinobacterium lividum]